MIKNADVIERLSSLIGKELTSETLHETLFCENKHFKIRRRFHVGTHSYIQYKIKEQQQQTDTQLVADILISGNPNTFRVGVDEKNGQLFINSEPRVSYTYL
ncbi:hypothetical protein EJF36_01000 [Bacillus sp. HMF5848]|uniref:hypothetical protein n=1 Tax=Bacillus sp. HMF5848 TaxID=2495421 RepID=UPI000F789918|nr:hypothetical protein [Bacillus sp. HMF5848]RSK25598.1 hypothetical protein EJF36_01000 [Bacillus sp. HMF5848]